MRSSTVIDQTRRKFTKQWEVCVRDLKAAKIGLNTNGKIARDSNSKENKIVTSSSIASGRSTERLWAGVLLGRLRPRQVQVRRRCVITGRGRGILRRFRMSRIKVRESALRGELAGVRKMTW